MSGKAALLIYDAQCPMCRRAREWALRHAQAGALDTLPCRSEDRPARAPGVSEQACLEAMHLVLPDGSVHAGADALPLLFARMRGHGWLAVLLGLPGVGRLARPVYQWIATHRLSLSRLFSKGEKQETCGLDGDCP